MRAWVVPTTLLLTVFVGSGLAACTVIAQSPRETPATTAPQPSGSTSQPVLPRVRLIATGGTISNKSGGRLSAEELVASIPGIERYVRPEFEQFANVAHWQARWARFSARAIEANSGAFRSRRDIASGDRARHGSS